MSSAMPVRIDDLTESGIVDRRIVARRVVASPDTRQKTVPMTYDLGLFNQVLVFVQIYPL